MTRKAATATIDGKRKFFYGATKKEARAKRDKYVAEHGKTKTLFRTIAEDWEEFAYPRYEYNTLKGYKPACRRAIEEFGDCDITSILPADVAFFIQNFAKKEYADKTVRTQLMVVNLIFKYAINYKKIAMQNPARDIEVPKNLKKSKITVPNSADIQAVKDGLSLPFGLFAYIAMYTGLRKGELLALEWSDIDRKRGVISVTKSLYHINNRPAVKRPKTKNSVREVPMPSVLFGVLPKKNKGLVFPDRHGGHFTERRFQRVWREYTEAAGVECTPHQLRHLYATMLFENNIDAKDAQYLLGHAQLSTTMDIYTEIRERRKDRIAEEIRDIDIA